MKNDAAISAVRKNIERLMNSAHCEHGTEFLCLMYRKDSQEISFFGTPAGLKFLSGEIKLGEEFASYLLADMIRMAESSKNQCVEDHNGLIKSEPLDADDDKKSNEPVDHATYIDDGSDTETEYLIDDGASVKIIESNADASVNTTFQDISLKSQLLPDASSKEFVCEYCARAFSKKGLLQSHMRVHGGRPFKCEQCGKGFTRGSHLRQHIITHTGNKQHQCEYCLRMFAQKITLRIHMRTHTGEKPFQCEHCSKGFAHRHPWLRHLATHSEAKPLVCRHCNEEFFAKAAYARHLRMHTGPRPECVCQYCNKEFMTRARMREHSRVHTGEKPFICQFCAKMCTQKSSLLSHMRVHSKDLSTKVKQMRKPSIYPCQHCEKRFTTKYGQKRHLLYHSGERPFACDKCDSSFMDRAVLRRHMVKHNEAVVNA